MSYSGWISEDALVARGRLQESLDFCLRGLNRFSELARFWDSEKDPYKSPREKIIVETALFLLLTSRASAYDQDIEQPVGEAARFLLPLVRCRQKAQILVALPYTALPFGVAHMALTLLGHPDEDFDSIARDAFDTTYMHGFERVPHRQLEVQWLRSLWDEQAVNTLDLPTGSVFPVDTHPIHMGPADAYALTHSIFYLTDFGRSTLAISEAEQSRLGFLIDACMAWQLQEENLDILAELMIAGLHVNRWPSNTWRVGWAYLNGIWDELGFLPGPNLDATHFGSLQADEKRAYAFQSCYHTVYVAGILSAAVLAGCHQHDSFMTRLASVKPTVSMVTLPPELRDSIPSWAQVARGRKSPMYNDACARAEALLTTYARAGAYHDLEELLGCAPGIPISEFSRRHFESLLGRHRRANMQAPDTGATPTNSSASPNG